MSTANNPSRDDEPETTTILRDWREHIPDEEPTEDELVEAMGVVLKFAASNRHAVTAAVPGVPGTDVDTPVCAIVGPPFQLPDLTRTALDGLAQIGRRN